MATTHKCNGECWAYLIRWGIDENSSDCDVFAAEAAAYAEGVAEGAIIPS
jgi:hypothetical protein